MTRPWPFYVSEPRAISNLRPLGFFEGKSWMFVRRFIITKKTCKTFTEFSLCFLLMMSLKRRRRRRHIMRVGEAFSWCQSREEVRRNQPLYVTIGFGCPRENDDTREWRRRSRFFSIRKWKSSLSKVPTLSTFFVSFVIWTKWPTVQKWWWFPVYTLTNFSTIVFLVRSSTPTLEHDDVKYDLNFWVSSYVVVMQKRHHLFFITIKHFVLCPAWACALLLWLTLKRLETWDDVLLRANKHNKPSVTIFVQT